MAFIFVKILFHTGNSDIWHCYRLFIYRGQIWYDIEHNTKVKRLQPVSDYKLRKDISFLALTGSYGASFLSSLEKTPRYIESAMYIHNQVSFWWPGVFTETESLSWWWMVHRWLPGRLWLSWWQPSVQKINQYDNLSVLVFNLVPPDICNYHYHYHDVIMTTMASQITSLTVVYSTVYLGSYLRKHQSSASLAFVPVNSPHKGPVTRKMFPFDDVIPSH